MIPRGDFESLIPKDNNRIYLEQIKSHDKRSPSEKNFYSGKQKKETPDQGEPGLHTQAVSNKHSELVGQRQRSIS